MKINLFLFGLIAVQWSFASPNKTDVKSIISVDADYRLQESTNPVNYDIEITPYLDDSRPNDKKLFTFDGLTKIQIVPSEDKDTLRLHSKLLQISEVKVSKFEKSKITIDDPIKVTIQNDTSVEIIVLTFSENLSKSVLYELEFTYTGQMDKDMRGFYQSSYVENGKTEWLGATQLQPTHARRVFPCFDEPSYKATFKLTLNIPNNYTALSNTKSELIDANENKTKYVFQETPTMSTYLLGFVIAKFQMRSDNINNGYKLAIYSRPDQYHLTEYPLSFGKKSLQYLDDYLEIKFEEHGLGKMDMVALPDFASGAMENWGLLTYKELYLLFDKTFSTDLDKREIALTVAHEQAHQWFGNLVTCDWWSNTWLNEGFATYFEFFVTAAIEPQWELEKTFITDTVHRALLFDSQDNTHALQDQNVNTPDEISGMFSLVSYQKGGSIIKMIEHFIGLDNFKNSLRNYLKEYSNKTSHPEYLLKHFQGSGDNITELFMPWITQSGYPVLTVTMNENRTTATLTQAQFLLNKKSSNAKWPIPLTYTTDTFNNLNPTYVFKSTENSYIIKIDAPKWVIFNVQQSGFYRVQYDNRSWEKISTALKEDNYDGIHEVNRAQIVDDLLNFGRSNDLDYKFVFNILLYLETEINYLPWHAAFNGFAFLSSRMTNDELLGFKSFVSGLIQTRYTAAGFVQQDGDTQLDNHLRSKLVEWSCKCASISCVTNSDTYFRNYIADETERIPVDIRTTVICISLRYMHNNITVYNTLWSRYQKQQIASEQIILLKAMGCTTDDVLIEHLHNIFSDQVRRQDKRTAFQATYTQYEQNLQIVLDYLIDRHEDVAQALEDKATFIGYLTGLADRFTLQSQIDQLVKFQLDTEKQYFDFKNTIQSAVEKANKNLEWNTKYIPVIMNFIKDQKLDESDNGEGCGVANSASLLILLFVAASHYVLY